MTSYQLLEQAPQDHLSEEFLQFLRDNNEVVWEDTCFLVIKNCKYDWLTAFAKHDMLSMQPLIDQYGQYEWRVKPADKRTVKRFHIHIITNL